MKTLRTALRLYKFYRTLGYNRGLAARSAWRMAT